MPTAPAPSDLSNRPEHLVVRLKLDVWGLRMVVRIAVDDADSAKSLVHALFGVFDGESVSLDADTHEISVDAERDSDRLVVDILSAVEAWLSRDGVPSARLQVGAHSYTVAQAAPAHAGSRP